MIATGFDIGGAHFKVARVEDGCITRVATFPSPVWRGVEHLASAFDAAGELATGADTIAFTMTAELSDIFPSREAGVAAVLGEIAARYADRDPLIYAGRSGFVPLHGADALAADIASANWHATAALVARKLDAALFADMGSTTTDLIPVAAGQVRNLGYTDAERLATGELVYTGFVRSFAFALAREAPLVGRMTPLMNEYFASAADVHRLLGVLDEADDMLPSADGQPKTPEGSRARIARMVGRDAADMPDREWKRIAAWFSEQQLRRVHDAAVRVEAGLPDDAPLVAAGIGRWQLARLAERLGRPLLDFAGLVPTVPTAAAAASAAAPASAVALLAADRRG
jgi:probable H4MPT-linked C1 transfer pathway protein